MNLSILFTTILVAMFAVDALSQGTPAVTRLWFSGRFADLERVIESKYPVPLKAPTAHLGPLCMAYSKLKRYSKLLDCLRELEARIAGGEDMLEQKDEIMQPPFFLGPFPHLLRAEALLDFGDYDAAIKEARLGLSKIREDRGKGYYGPPRYRFELLPIVALAQALKGDEAEARKAIQELKDVRLGFGEKIMETSREQGLARVYMALRDYSNAIDYIKRDSGAFAFRVTGLFLGGESYKVPFELAKSLMLGKALVGSGKFQEAVETLDQLLAHPRLADQSDIQWLALVERAQLAEEYEKDLGKALELYRRAIDIFDRQRASISTEINKIGFVGDKQAVYARVIAVLMEQGRAAEAFDYVERSKSRALVDLLASRRDFSVRGKDEEKAKQILAQLTIADGESRGQDESARPGESAGLRSLEIARREIRSAAPELSTLVTVTSVSTNELKDLIGEDEALVVYYYHSKNLYAFVLSRERLQAVKLDATGLAEQVQKFRKALEQVGSQAWQSLAQVLHERLWKPIGSRVTAKRVIIVPHGALHYVPFAALQREDGSFLLDHYVMRFLPSASVLKFLKPSLAKKEEPLLAFGNPDLGDPKLDLAFAESEARALGGLYANSRVLLRRDATETSFKKLGGLYQRIHFATHGKFNSESPLDSGLYLAKDGENDGVLTVGELYSMAIDADLVTLSACETGLGKVNSGDDVVGLARGFLYAGARSIVASLWSVDDKATAELMQAFYQNLAAGSKHEALRQAQLKIRAAFSHPFFWAPFQLTGRAD